MKIIPLNEGDFVVNKNKEFALLNPAETVAGIRMAVQPFLVLIDDEAILLDAGLSWTENGLPKLVTNLADAGLQSNAITKVLLSHLHKDHIDGLIVSEPAGFRLVFPKAKVCIQRREYDYTLTKRGACRMISTS